MSVFFDLYFRSVVNVDDPAGDRAEREADGLVRRLRKEVGGPKLALPSQVRHFENILLSELNWLLPRLKVLNCGLVFTANCKSTWVWIPPLQKIMKYINFAIEKSENYLGTLYAL